MEADPASWRKVVEEGDKFALQSSEALYLTGVVRLLQADILMLAFSQARRKTEHTLVPAAHLLSVVTHRQTRTGFSNKPSFLRHRPGLERS